MVWFQEQNYHQLDPHDLRLRWDKSNLTVDETAKVRVSLWGYREDSVHPKMEYIDMIAVRTFFFISSLLFNNLKYHLMLIKRK